MKDWAPPLRKMLPYFVSFIVNVSHIHITLILIFVLEQMLPFAQRLCIRNENFLQKYSVYVCCHRGIFYVMSLGLQIYAVKGKSNGYTKYR